MRRAKAADRTRQRAARAGDRANEATVWTRVLGQFVTRAQQLGVDRAALLQRAQLAERDLEDPDSRAPLTSCYSVLEAAEALSRDPLLHMRMARALDYETFDAVACAAMSSPTLRASLRAMLRYQRLWSDGEVYEFTELAGWGRVTFVPWGPPRRAHTLMAEIFAVDVAVNSAIMTGGPFESPRVLLRSSTPQSAKRAAEHRELLHGIEAEFEQARDEVWIRTTDLNRRVAPEGREAIYRFFERYLDEKMRALPDSLSARVSLLLTRDVAKYDSVINTAKALRMSPRTLQRRLAAEGTSLRKLADQARRARALALLETGHSIAEIVWLLGFAEPSVFHRVFKRWTGQTPESYRQRVPRSPARSSQR